MTAATKSRLAQIAQGEFPSNVPRNAVPAKLYEEALNYEHAHITSTGGIASLSGEKTGRSPGDKRVVRQPESEQDVWWGDINIPMTDDDFASAKAKAVEFLDDCEHLYVLDAYAGWDPANRLKIRVICSRAYHALFMHNMLIRPTKQELANFGEPDYVIYNAGPCSADPSFTDGESTTSVSLNFGTNEMVILGTEYAGEMKKGVFTIMNYLMPKNGVLSMHCSANMGEKTRDVSLFFGLSGTGKTTLSADPERKLIGDDEHCWHETGVFNIEGGCYAKCIGLSAKREPQIFNAIRFGSILENTVQDPVTHEVDFDNVSITQNTRCSYPINYIKNAQIPCIGPHPKNIILLTCDAFGILPPVSRLTPAQAMYHFISGYTAKVAGTEVGVDEPEATFSACFGAAFLVWHPTKYAKLLAEKIREHNSQVWLVNTGWSGGAFGSGERISLEHTRAIIDAIHRGELDDQDYTPDPVFGISIPAVVRNVPTKILVPRNTWADPEAFDIKANELAKKFVDNFAHYADQADEEIMSAAPKVR